MLSDYSSRIIIPTALREVDVTEFRDLVEHPIFNNLEQKTQLSFVEKHRRGGRQSRYEHSIFVYHFTKELCKILVEMGFLTEEEARHVRGASVVHDLGHPPFSHAIDNLLSSLYSLYTGSPKNHHARTKELINNLSDIIKSIGLDTEEIIRIAAKEDEKSKIISHNTLGTDKLGYLLLDSHHTGYRFWAPFILDMFPHYYYSADSLGIQEEKRYEVEDIQTFIQKMYMAVYLHPTVLRYSRFIQKAVESAVRSEELNLDDIWDMPEGALIYRLSHSNNPQVKKQMERYETSRDQKPDATLKIRGDDRHILLPKEILDSVSRELEIPLKITELEKDLSNEFGLEEDSVYITIPACLDRVIPENVDLYDGRTKRGTLFERYPTHFKNLLERAEDFFALRIYSDSDEKFPGPDKVNEFFLCYFGMDK